MTLRGTRVLLVDDDSDVLDAMGLLLSEHVEVLTSSGAEEAISVLERVDVEVIITDLRMPERDGLDLLREVRRRWPATRRFLATGEQVEKIDDGLVEAFFTKPVDVTAILAVLMRTTGDKFPGL